MKALDIMACLELKHHAPMPEIKSAYYKAARRFHPDMHFYLEDADLKEQLSDIFAYVYEAYATLTNPEKRKEYDKLITVKPAKLISKSGKARTFFEEGKFRMKENNFVDAELLFGQAAYFDDTVAEYHYHYGLALIKLDKLKLAEKAINRALKLDPKNADYLAKLGFVCLELNLPIKAKTFFRQALEISPDHTSASEGIRKVT